MYELTGTIAARRKKPKTLSGIETVTQFFIYL